MYLLRNMFVNLFDVLRLIPYAPRTVATVIHKTSKNACSNVEQCVNDRLSQKTITDTI